MSDETQGTASPPAEGTTVEQVADKGTEQQVETKEAPEGEQQAEQAGDKPEGEPERKRLSGAQKAKRRETFLLNQLADRERELQEARQASRQTEDQPDADKPPKEEDFNGDWTAYVAARAAFEAGKAVESKLTARETKALEAKQSEAERERDLEHLERVEEAREVIADYDKVMAGMKGVSVSNDLIREIKSSEDGALIAYELALNPDRLHAMNRMTPIELAREMGRLEASVKKPAGKKQTKAPPPPTTLKGGAAPAVDLAKADMDTYVAARKAQGFGAER
jgi:hypothetical protein